MGVKILDIDPGNYRKHFIHGEDREWIETNCYMDLWIELLHSLGYDPVAALTCVFGLDFEGDQWTFFKYSLADLEKMYGLDVQELNIWKDLLSNVEEQLQKGRPVLVELDSFYLPDTKGTAYQLEHTKTTVAINELDVAQKRMGYFHNQGYFELQGEDFEQLFTVAVDERVLPPYVEYVRPRSREKLNSNTLFNISLEALRYQIDNLPQHNPFLLFKARFLEEFSDLDAVDIAYFHKYSFATLRQYGAAFELCKTYLEWAKPQLENPQELEKAITAYGNIAASSKVLQFQLARAIARRKSMDLTILDESARLWQEAADCLRSFF